MQVIMQTHFNARNDAVCQLSEVGSGKVLWGCFFNPQSDTSMDICADERELWLKQNNAEIIWPEETN